MGHKWFYHVKTGSTEKYCLINHTHIYRNGQEGKTESAAIDVPKKAQCSAAQEKKYGTKWNDSSRTFCLTKNCNVSLENLTWQGILNEEEMLRCSLKEARTKWKMIFFIPHGLLFCQTPTNIGQMVPNGHQYWSPAWNRSSSEEADPCPPDLRFLPRFIVIACGN